MKKEKAAATATITTEEDRKGVYSWQIANEVRKCMCEHCKEIWRRAERSDDRDALTEWANH
jgi:hypothetical protein